MTPIHEFAVNYGRAFESGDVEQIMELITDDFVALTPDKPALVGRAAVRKEIVSDLAQMNVLRLQFIHQDVVVADQWAFAWGLSDGEVSIGQETASIEGKYLWVLKLHEDGRWKLARDSAHGELFV